MYLNSNFDKKDFTEHCFTLYKNLQWFKNHTELISWYNTCGSIGFGKGGA